MPNTTFQGIQLSVSDFLNAQKTILENAAQSNTPADTALLPANRQYRIPKYQREIRWGIHQLDELINDILHDKKYIGHVILHKGVSTSTFDIIDGQQRITSLILAKLGYYPDFSKYESAEDVADGDDDADDDPDTKTIRWTFNELLVDDPSGNTIEAVKLRLATDNRYKQLTIPTVNEEFLKNSFLGFSFIVPECKSSSEIQKSYSQIFRNINYLGKSLSVLESRRSLYYMDAKYQRYFEGWYDDEADALCDIKLFEKMKLSKIDFVRYLACLSQYSIDEDKNKVMKWYSSFASRESFHADYVSYLMGLDQEAHNDKFNGFAMDTTFPNDCWAERLTTLHDAVNELKASMNLNEDNAFTSWIDADYWLFGLIYQILFNGKSLVEEKAELIEKVKNKIQTKRADASYSKSPNRLGNLRDRLSDSITIFSEYVQ